MITHATLLMTAVLWATTIKDTEAPDSLTQMVVVNAETKVPVRDVKIFTDSNRQLCTAWDGRFLLPDSFHRISFHHPQYEQRYILKSELHGDTIFLLPKANALGEVVIWGERRFDNRMRGIMKPSPQQAERDRLPQVIPAGPNILAIAAWLFDITFGKKIETRRQRKKALKEVRRKEAEYQQRWDLLRDTTNVNLRLNR